MAPLPSRVNVLAELERVGRKYAFSGSDEVRLLCPFHEDNSPSASINTDSAEFYCHVCKKGTDFIGYLSRVLSRDRDDVFADLAGRYDIENEPTVDPEVIDRWHSRIWDAGPLLKELRARGVSDDVIRARRLGENQGRVTIPVKSPGGRWVNVRLYLPGAPGADKMKNLKGRGKPRLYPIEQLRFDKIALCGGEVKAVVAADKLNPHLIGGLCATCGEGNWDDGFTEKFRGKIVYIVYDVDQEGVDSAQRIASMLYPVCAAIYVVSLPLDVAKYPSGDVNDFVAEGGDLFRLLESQTETWKPKKREELDYDEIPQEVSIKSAYTSQWTKKRIKIEATVSAIAEDRYILPREFSIKCDRDQDCCPLCPIFIAHTETGLVREEDPVILEMIAASKNSQRYALMRHMSVPMACRSVEFEPTSWLQADDIRVSPKLDLLDTNNERAFQRVIVIKDDIQPNENYAFVGRQYPHPATQSAVMLASDWREVGDALSHYSLGDCSHLEKFQPRKWTEAGLVEFYDSLYADLERNVTQIVQRRDMHLAMDLFWHSPLFMTFEDTIRKAYTEILIVGDSSQGKSEASQRLLAHYGVGAKMDCKNASVAGMLGGVQQIGGRWFVTWGVIPTHDRRALILEEFKGASVECISKLTDMRSSGIAEIPKIEKRRAMARTRLLAVSNSRSGRPLSSYSYGIEAIKELVGAMEDIRRFDMCMTVRSDEVDASVINMLASERPHVPHVYDSASCRELVLWAWTRKPDQVTFESGAEKLVLDTSTALCTEFSGEIPIVDSASMRLKLARLAAASAARTFSNIETSTLMVRKCHVEHMASFLRRVYSSPSFGYTDFSKSVEFHRHMAEPDAVIKRMLGVIHARDFIENLLRASKFDVQDVMDWCGSDRVEAQSLLSLLSRKRAVTRHGRSYVKSSDFIDVLKKLVADGLPDTPKHLENPEF